MKKILSVFLALMISAFLLASCGASPSSNRVSGTRFNGDYEIASHEKFNSPADQNGLGGSKIVAAGILQELIQVDTSTVGILKSEDGEWLIFLSDEIYETYAVSQVSDWELEGKEVSVFGIYEGYSDAYQMPVINIMCNPDREFNGGKILDENSGKEYDWSDIFYTPFLAATIIEENASHSNSNTETTVEDSSAANATFSGMPGIVGSQVYDLILSLENEGIPKAETVNIDGGFQYTSSTTQYAYSITANSDHEIASAQFFVFEGGDKAYLSFCATLPYEEASPDDASQWVQENIGTDNSTMFGDAIFSLSSGTQGPILTIKSVRFDDYILSMI